MTSGHGVFILIPMSGTRMKKMVFAWILLGLVVILVPSAWAGSSQAGGPVFFPVKDVSAFSKKVEKSLAKHGAKVAIVGRVGRPRKDLPRGIAFTHTGFAVYSKITTVDGRTLPGYAMYNLYQDSDIPDQSTLVLDYPVDFFAGVRVLEAGVIVPSPRLQAALLEILSSNIYTALHDPSYSAIANPYTLGFQNCTEHVLDILFAAIYGTDDMKKIKANQTAYFKAQPVHVNPLKLALGRMFAPDITTADHPGSPETATFSTIGSFLTGFGLVSAQYVVLPGDAG